MYLLAAKKTRNGCHHDIRPERYVPLDTSVLQKVSAYYEDLEKVTPSDEMDNAFHLLVECLENK